MAMRLPTPPTQGPRRGLLRTSGSLSIAALRILASPLGESASPAISGTTFERSRMRPFESRIPGFSRPLGPKRTSFMDSPWGLEASCAGRYQPADDASAPLEGQGSGASYNCAPQTCYALYSCCLWATDAPISFKRAYLRGVFICNGRSARTD